ncbi:hypothetical protein ED733_008155 [Metarhizium rileyi]|uniref:Uncharacterized protein n=1 Tax=Metarhizium rileyi (strain RCEF 4871) TaxID=1649241 RepID=A0A5C6GNJ2_METRR|nr:hypothetical protein ED733_008155 [Metarhizium rileyi]
MPGFKFSILTGLVAVLGALVTGGVAESGADHQSVKTLDPKPIGTATDNGVLLVSMNYCSVVMNTQCQVSVMTSAPGSEPAPTPAPGPPESASAVDQVETDGAVATRSAIESVIPVPTRFSAPSPPGAESTEVAATTQTESPINGTGDITKPAGTAPGSSSAGAPAVTSSALAAAAAAADSKALPGALWGAAILAMAVVL